MQVIQKVFFKELQAGSFAHITDSGAEHGSISTEPRFITQ